MLSVALTGNIASGKSTVAALFQGWGATIIDADQLVRAAQAPGSPVSEAIAARFGREFLGPDGELRRDALRGRVLNDPAARTDLERIVHPVVERLRREREAVARGRGDRIVVSDIPLLFEAADPSAFDVIVLVDAPAGVRHDRLVQRGLTGEEAEWMMKWQQPSGPKRSRSTYVIDNDGSLPALERAALTVWEALLARA